MNMNDRIALELGRALLRALIAENRVQELQAQPVEVAQEQKAETPAPSYDGGTVKVGNLDG